MIALTNIGEGGRSYRLSHEYFCKLRGRCTCTRARYTGAHLPRELAFAEKQRHGRLSRAVLSVPAVEDAIRRGVLRAEVDCG